MYRETEIGGMKARINNISIFLDDFHFTSAQVEKITGLLGLVGRMAELKAFPPKVSDPPFNVEFKEDGNHLLSCGGGYLDPTGSVPFTFESIDELIQHINTVNAISLDMQRLAPETIPRGGPIGPLPGDIIEGR